MCAAAGVPILTDSSEYSDDGDYMELSDYQSVPDYQQQLMRDGAPPQFDENDQWPVTSRGYPLKERYLQLLCGSEHSEFEQYYNVIDHWTPSDEGTLDVDMKDVAKVLQVMPQRKRGFDQLRCDGSTASDWSRPVTEVGVGKTRDSRWGMFGVFSAIGDGGSE